MTSFQGKRALVTGGARGIGLDIVKELLKKGADVIALGSNQLHLDNLSKDVI